MRQAHLSALEHPHPNRKLKKMTAEKIGLKVDDEEINLEVEFEELGVMKVKNEEIGLKAEDEELAGLKVENEELGLKVKDQELDREEMSRNQPACKKRIYFDSDVNANDVHRSNIRANALHVQRIKELERKRGDSDRSSLNALTTEKYRPVSSVEDQAVASDLAVRRTPCQLRRSR